MNKRQLIIALFWVSCHISSALAYMENYPPYKFKDDPFKHLEAEVSAYYNTPEFRSKDGRIVIKFEEPFGLTRLTIQDGKLALVKVKENGGPLPHAAYQVDVDNNGFKDFLVFYHWGASSLAGDQAEVFLNKDGKSYQKITYETIRSGLEDFVDLNQDGKYEVIITGVYAGKKHNYFTYNIYEIKNYKLVNADAKFKGLPKFIWMTNKPNDRDTVHLTKGQRDADAEQKSRSIKYEEIK